MIAGDNQLKLRDVFKEILAHEPSRDLVAAGQRLDPTLRPHALTLIFCEGLATIPIFSLGKLQS